MPVEDQPLIPGADAASTATETEAAEAKAPSSSSQGDSDDAEFKADAKAAAEHVARVINDEKNPPPPPPRRREKFIPTAQWVKSWKSRMNLSTITRLLQARRVCAFWRV